MRKEIRATIGLCLVLVCAVMAFLLTLERECRNGVESVGGEVMLIPVGITAMFMLCYWSDIKAAWRNRPRG